MEITAIGHSMIASNNRTFLNLASEAIDNYTGKPVYIMATGAGVSLAMLNMIPGSSKMIEGICIPYGKKSSGYNSDGIQEDWSAVSREMTESYYHRAKALYPDFPIVIVNGALITNRYRKGQNHAYIKVNDRMYHIVLPKETEESWNTLNSVDMITAQRMGQDESIARVAIRLLLGQDIPEAELKGCTLEEVVDE